MRAITLASYGGPEVLTLGEAPDPEPGPGEVLVAVTATAVNRADVMQRRGHYPPPPGASEILGLECSGTVAALGPHVTGWSVGDEVCALLTGGGYAEQVVVPAGQLLPVPAGLSLTEAAALPEVACTVWSNVILTGRLAPAEVFLVHGGSSGIGTLAIQVAAELGARVACTAGSRAKLERCAELGAQVLVNYRESDFVAEVKAATGGRGADLVLDNMGASYLARNLAALAPDGRLVVIGLQGGRVGEVDLGAMLTKRLSLHCAGLRGRSLESKSGIVSEVRVGLWPMVEGGRVRPVIDRVLPLAEAAEAHRVIEASEHVGKVLLEV